MTVELIKEWEYFDPSEWVVRLFRLPDDSLRVEQYHEFTDGNLHLVRAQSVGFFPAHEQIPETEDDAIELITAWLDAIPFVPSDSDILRALSKPNGQDGGLRTMIAELFRAGCQLNEIARRMVVMDYVVR